MKKLVAIISLMLFGIGFWYETPSASRSLWLLLCFFLFSFCLLAVEMRKEKALLSSVLWCFGGLSLGLLEHFSKYSVNEYFQLLYFLLPISLYYRGRTDFLKKLMAFSALILSYKYVYLMYVKWEAFKPQSLVVIVMLYGLVSVVIGLALSLKLEKQQLASANKTLTERTEHLVSANEKLNLLMDQLEQLTVVRERQNMAREIHDTVGHGLTALIMKLEMSRHYFNTAPDSLQGEELLGESIKDARTALKATRQVVETLSSKRRSAKDLEALVSQIANDPDRQILLEGSNWIEILLDAQSHALYRAVQEGITNYLKHSDLPRFEINLVYKDKLFKLTMGGVGMPKREFTKRQLPELEKISSGGFGLKAMKYRIEESGGTFSMREDQGFLIEITFLGERIIGGANT